MSTRKRVDSVSVQKILSQIRSMTRKDSSIYDKLSSYDKVLKKYRIDSLNEVALEIYEYLIEQQTIASLPERSGLRNDQFKFSRVDIQVQGQSQKLNHHIQDPEIHNPKLFSFAKNNKHQNKKNINEQNLIPKQLFVDSSRPDSRNQKYQSFMHQEQQIIFAQENQKQLNQFKSKSVKSLSQISNTQIIASESVVFNSEKTKEVQKDQQVTSISLFRQYLKRKYLNQLVTLVKCQNEETRKISIEKKVKFIYCMKLLIKGFDGLKINQQHEQINMQKALQFSSLKEQNIVEQAFIEWKDFSTLPFQLKERIEKIQQKSTHLNSFLFINRLKCNSSLAKLFRRENNQRNDQLQQKSQILQKILFFHNLKSKFIAVHNQKEKLNHLEKYIRINTQKNIMSKIIRFRQQERQKQLQLIKKCNRTTQGRRLITQLRNQQNFMEVYWRGKQNPKKLIFLNYFLGASKQAFQRMGYHYPWMTKYQQNIRVTDQKVQFALSRDRKLKAFKRLFRFYQNEKQKKRTIKIMLADNILKHLTYSSYINVKRKSESQKTNELLQGLYKSRGAKIIQILSKRKIKQFSDKEDVLCKYLFESKTQQFFIYLESYKRTKQLYSEVLDQFEAKRRHNFLSMVWIGFKRVLKGQVINNKLVNEYRKLKNQQIVEKCFDQFRNNIFQEKLLRKRSDNVKKFIKLRSFNQLCKKLNFNLKYQFNQKKQNQEQFSELLIQKKQSYFFEMWRDFHTEVRLRRGIETKLDQNYEFHILAKCFRTIKFITVKTKQEEELKLEIKRKNERNLMRKYFQRMIQIIVKRNSGQHFVKVLTKTTERTKKLILEAAFQNIKNYQTSLESQEVSD